MPTTPSRDAPSPGLAAPEDAFIALQDLSPDGFMMFAPVRGPDGEIADLEWTFVNAAAGRIVGRRPDDLIGRHLLVEMPGNRDEGLFDAYVRVIETGETWQREFHYDHGDIDAWFRTTAARSGNGLAMSFADISEVKRGEERLKDLIDGVIAFVGVLSLDGRLLEANEPAVAASGLRRDQLIGVPFWDCYWWSFDPATQQRLKDAVAAAARGERVRYDAEIRIRGDQRIWIDFQIVPLRDKAGNVVELIPSGVDITERKLAESQKELLIKELAHRVKNTLATIQSMTRQTIRFTGTPDEFRASFNARLRSIAASHDLLVASEHQAVALAALIRGQVEPYASEDGRLSLSGDDILLPGELAHKLGLVLHELATNASKYGALSATGGTVEIAWRVERLPERTLRLEWRERGGPRVEQPTRQGFGTRLIERSFSAEGDEAAIRYEPEGVVCLLRMELE